MIKINLIRSETEKKSQITAKIDEFLEALPPSVREYANFYKHPIFIKLVVLLILVKVAGTVIETVSVKILANVEEQRKELQQEIAKAKQDEKKLKDNSNEEETLKKIRAEKDEINQKLVVLKSVASVRFRIFNALNRISASIPDKVWITDMNIEEKVIRMKGSSWEFRPISAFESNLKNSGYFFKVSSPPITTSPVNLNLDNFSVPGNLEDLKSFEIIAELKTEAGLNEGAFEENITDKEIENLYASLSKSFLSIKKENNLAKDQSNKER